MSVDDGNLSDELRRLVGGLQDWARSIVPDPEQLHTGPDCQWCPLCQFAEVLRGEHPEVSEKITEAGAAFVNAVRSIFDAAGRPPATSQRPSDRPRPRPYPVPPNVQHIHLDDETD